MRSRTNWLARLVRGRRLGRNPLRRGSDRAETVVFCALLAGFLAAAPFAAHTAGSWAYATSAREAQAQRATLRQVPAAQIVPAAQVVPAGATAGSTSRVWVDRTGRLADPPLGHVQLVTRSQLAAELADGALAIALATAAWLIRRMLDRRRMAAWDADWLATGPRWSPRR